MNRVSNMELVMMELMAQANAHARKDGKEINATMIRVVVVTLQIAHYVGVRLGHIAVLVRVNVFVLNFNVKNWRLRFTSKQSIETKPTNNLWDRNKLSLGINKNIKI